MSGTVVGYYEPATTIAEECENVYWYNKGGNISSAFGSYTTASYNLPGFSLETDAYKKNSYQGFDFTNMWKIDENISTPKLKGFK